MKITGIISTGVLILVIVFSCCFSDACGQASQNESAVKTEQRVPETSQKREESRPRMNFVRMADFYLRSGELISGKLVSEDKNKITIEQLDDGRIIISTYSKREIDSRTLRTKNVPEYKHYLDLAEYFSSRTWDFRDDPDDFIQAIRCYEKAKQTIAQTRSRDGEKIEQINERIKHLQEDRQVWIRETKSRAELKKLEFEATLEARLKKLEHEVNANSRQVDSSIEQLDEFMANMIDDYQELEEVVSGINRDMSRQLEILEDRIEANKRLIDSRWRSRPYYYYPYRRRYKPGAGG